MTIPMNDAGQRAFEIFYKIAERLYTEARAAVDEYERRNCPDSRTLWEKHENGKYQRTVTTATGESQVISYDYETKEIATA